MNEYIGWFATFLFALSYLFRNPQKLRYFQAIAATVWIVYGLNITAYPVVVANAVVASLALASAWRDRKLNAFAKTA